MSSHLRAYLGAAALAMALPAHAEQRAPSEAERAGFYRYYQQQHPDAQGVQAVLRVVRATAAEPWRVGATVDSPPVRGLRTLCRMQRSQFVLADGWTAAAPPRQMVWLQKGDCSAPAAPVALAQRMPDSELVGMLEQYPKLLQSARLLFSGNTQCARQRAYHFKLAAIEVGTAGSSSEEMVGLVFESDRATVARVWVRRTGLDYDAWNVSCQ